MQAGVENMHMSSSILPASAVEQVRQVEGVREAVGLLYANAGVDVAGNLVYSYIFAVDNGVPFGGPWQMAAGRGAATDDEILLDSWLAQRAGISLGETVALLGHEFTVVGLTRETASWMSPYVFASLKAASEALGLNNMVSYHLLRLPPGADVNQAIAAIKVQVPGVDALTPAGIAAADRRVLANVMDAPLNAMLIIGAVIGVAVMGLTAYTAVADRVREYGVLKAVGAGGPRLAWQVICGTFYRAVLGYALGIGLAYLSAALIMARWPQFSIVILPQSVAVAGILALLFTVFSFWWQLLSLSAVAASQPEGMLS